MLISFLLSPNILPGLCMKLYEVGGNWDRRKGKLEEIPEAFKSDPSSNPILDLYQHKAPQGMDWEIRANTAILCSCPATDNPSKAQYLRSSWSYWRVCWGNCGNHRCHCQAQGPHRACAWGQGWCHCRGPQSRRKALFPCTGHCRRGSRICPGKRGRAPGCAQFRGSWCVCGQGCRRRRDSARCHLQGKREWLLSLPCAPQDSRRKGEEHTAKGSSSGSSILCNTDSFSQSQTHFLPSKASSHP